MKSKKGFTVVELVIVIAIIAILATALIPTFGGLIGKANLTKDQQAVRNMNMDLIVAMAEGKLNSAGDAITALGGEGFYGAKLAPFTKDYHYAYDAEQKMMYLLDNTGKPVFPNDKAEKANLWVLYSNRSTDYIEGFEKYVATEGIHSSVQFDVFAGKTATIDLAKNTLTVAKPANANITVLNGYTSQSGYGVEPMKTSTLAKGNSVSAGSYTEEIISLNGNISIADGASVVFENCVFDQFVQFDLKNGAKLSLRNCTFVGASSYALSIYGGIFGGADDVWYTGEAEIVDCNFVNCGRGINLVGTNSSNILIEGNTFSLTTQKAAVQLQLSGEKTEGHVTIKNNEFTACSAAVAVREGCYELGANAADLVTFSGNTMGKDIPGVEIDSDYTNGAITDETKVSGLKAAYDAIAAKFN